MEDGFDPEQFPRHDLSMMINTFGGRGKLACETRPISLETAHALRAMLKEALARLDAEIKAASET